MRKKVLVLGATGMVGSALIRSLNTSKYECISTNSKNCDLLNFEQVHRFLSINKPELIINASGISGGITFNKENQGYLYLSNQRMLTNLLEVLDILDVKQFVNIISSCVYPNGFETPFEENQIGSGSIEVTNLGYASAKLSGYMGTKLLGAEKGRNWINIVGSNLYGPGDSIDPEKAHVISALTLKLLDALKVRKSEITLMGDGSAIRDWLHVNDFASAFWKIVECDSSGTFNISSGVGISIREIVEMLIEIIGYKGDIKWSHNKMNGAPYRVLSNKKIRNLNWQPRVTLEDGLAQVVKDINVRAFG